jgi:hypothetical protein
VARVQSGEPCADDHGSSLTAWNRISYNRTCGGPFCGQTAS